MLVSSSLTCVTGAGGGRNASQHLCSHAHLKQIVAVILYSAIFLCNLYFLQSVCVLFDDFPFEPSDELRLGEL